jgi:hypothetical protein
VDAGQLRAPLGGLDWAATYTSAIFPANLPVPSEATHSLALVTGKLIDIRERLLDAADLMIDFATLGEYGIEVEPVRDCERRPSGLASGAPHPLHDRAGVPERIAA